MKNDFKKNYLIEFYQMNQHKNNSKLFIKKSNVGLNLKSFDDKFDSTKYPKENRMINTKLPWMNNKQVNIYKKEKGIKKIDNILDNDASPKIDSKSIKIKSKNNYTYDYSGNVMEIKHIESFHEPKLAYHKYFYVESMLAIF